MRNDHVSPQSFPTPEEVERAMRRAHRMRSEVVHGYLGRAAEWLGGLVRPRPAPAPAPQHC